MAKKGSIPWNKGKKNIYSKAILKSNSNKHKGSYEERYGPERAKDIKKKISIAGSKRILSEDHKKRIGKKTRLRLTGKSYEEIHGKEKAKIIKEKISKNSWPKKMKGNFPESTLLKKRNNNLGENNPMFGKLGKEHPGWKGGLSFEPYPPTFNKHFKLSIKQRDNFTCLKCNLNEVDHKQLYNGQGLITHHLDYKKLNTTEFNCCCLCHRCHAESNFNRPFWTIFFRSILSQRYGYKYKKGETLLQ